MQSLKFGLSFILLAGLTVIGGRHGLFDPSLPGIAAFMDPFGGVWQQAVAVTAKEESVYIKGETVGEVAIDERGIPHVFADELSNALYIQGYLHARDRLFQMDLSVRATGGRLAEVLGPNLLERDRLQRRKGLRVAAERTAHAWMKNPETAQAIRSYCAGVNSYISELTAKDYPVEYKLLGFEPEPWSVFKSALLAKGMAETLCFRHYDIGTTNARNALGDSLFAHLYPEYNLKDSPVISSTPWLEGESNVHDVEETDEALSEYIPFPTLPQSPEGIGSNNWALAGAKTASGAPLLSNDPHLSLTLPSIWYEIHLVTNEYNVYGVSLAGLPSILIGFNEQAAWGITNVGQDVLDWYKINWTDSTQTHYWLDGESIAPEFVYDTVYVRSVKEPEIVKTPWTVFGPVVYDQPGVVNYNLAMRWVAHDAPFDEVSDNLESFLDMAKAYDLPAYIRALSAFDSPGSNVVYANQNNDIALTVSGRFPMRKPQQGKFIQDGSTRANEWQGFIPYEENPRDVNPERQFVASANQRSAGLTYPYYYLGGFEDYRGRYINRKLEELSNARPEDMMALQYDAYGLKAEDALPLMLAAMEGVNLEPEASANLELLRAWDYRYEAKAQGPIIFESWLDSLYRLTFDELYAIQSEDNPISFPEQWRLIELIETAPNDAVFDLQGTTEKETAGDLIHKAFLAAENAVAPILEAGTGWSEHRGTRIRHLARIPGFGSDLIQSDGNRGTPNALSATFGPSWRMVISLEKPLRAWGVLPGGSAGNVGSPFYTEGIEEWSKGEYFELNLYKAAAEVTTRQRLLFGNN